MKGCLILLSALSIFHAPLQGQVINFKESFQKNDPVSTASTISIPDRIKAHQNFLEQATIVQDRQKQFYGMLYLFLDYLKSLDYPEAARNLLKAETMANDEKDLAWQGMVAHFKGVLNVRMQKNAAAIPCYEQAAALCAAAHDSLCLGESLEQIAAMHTSLKNFEQARKYFELAIPLLEKYGDQGSSATALNNFGLFHFNQELYVEAIRYFKRSEDMYRKIGKHKEEAQALNNQAAALINLRRFEEAIKIYQHCIQLNKEFDQYDNIITNYSGLANLYEDKGDLTLALAFLNKYYNLRDSLIGAETQKEIADLQVKYAIQQTELELQKSEAALRASQHSIERFAWVFSFLVVLAVLSLWRWRVQTHRAVQKRKENEKKLRDLTRILLDKNSRLANLEALVSTSVQEQDNADNARDFEENLLSQRILTPDDWEGFKACFDETYPGYLSRLRAKYLALSNAEERLFLLLKLNLTNREAAAILGISVESVKKTRNRLRHRLELSEETDLGLFIRDF